MSPEGFLSTNHNTGLVISTDGVPIFKSSKGSLWPVYLMVTSIPPHQRSRVDNLIVASLWFGPTKPNMNIMLEPILRNISSLEEGIVVKQQHSTSDVIIRAKLVLGIFDLPAKAAVTNTKQFNGEHGCFYCLDKGEVHNRSRIYPPHDQHLLRSSHQMKKWAAEAERGKVTKFGVKGYSFLSEYLSFPESIPIDYMHSILEGVFKQLMKLWFDSSSHSQPYSLRKHIACINRVLERVKPPLEIQRMPRSIQNISFYKASEYRAWLLFYAVPICSFFLPPDYTHHLILLVNAIHILLSDKIKKSDLSIAYSMLSTFYQEAGNLYSCTIYTANMHSLEHIVGMVELWGPLWAYSMFGFENLNGYLGNKYHGTQKIVYQLSFQIQLIQALPDMLQECSSVESPEAQAYIEKTLSRNHNNMQEIYSNCYSIGKVSLHTLTDEEKRVASRHGFTSNEVYMFYRLMLAQTIYYSEKYTKRSCSRNNSVCCYLMPTTNNYGYGQIMGFYWPTNEIPFCIVKVFEIDHNSSPLTKLRPSLNEHIREITSQNHFNKVFHHINESAIEQLIAIPLKNIVRKCLLINIPIQGKNTTFIIPCPNIYEVH